MAIYLTFVDEEEDHHDDDEDHNSSKHDDEYAIQEKDSKIIISQIARKSALVGSEEEVNDALLQSKDQAIFLQTNDKSVFKYAKKVNHFAFF